MNDQSTQSALLDLLNEALARELHVSILYTTQHTIGAGNRASAAGKKQMDKQNKFIASESMWRPSSSLKKIGIAEMIHAEDIAERIVVLGGEPTTEHRNITVGNHAAEMLQNDREQEQKAIVLYKHIIEVAEREQDDSTMNLFKRILLDEERHHRIFMDLLG
jgi:bacterioferritin